MESNTDRIRAFAKEHFIDPPRSRGEGSIVIRAGDVRSAMKLHTNSTPAVCSALRSRFFHELCAVRLTEFDGPLQGSNARFTFEILNEPEDNEERGSRRYAPRAGRRSRPGRGPKLTRADLVHGHEVFLANEGRDSMYRVATFLVEEWWGKPAELVDALTLLLLTWNSAFYRYGMFDQAELGNALADEWKLIESFRRLQVTTFGAADHATVRTLFEKLLTALRIAEGSSAGKISPVGIGKTLHLLAPGFFPLWVDAIAKEYGCRYARDPAGAYLRFCGLIQEIAMDLGGESLPPTGTTLVKLIDECNYARYTKHWIT